MTLDEALRELEACGTAQNRKVYRRHGIGEDMFGVSFADLNKIKKRTRTDHALAEALWTTGNHDARMLATMIADPNDLAKQRLDDWARDLDNYVIADAFGSLASKTPHARDRMEKWAKSKDEWTGRAGWQLLAHLAMQDDSLDDDFFAKRLVTIEREIHTHKNMVRHAMNGALIAIGLRNQKLQRVALASAQRIGKVEVDHGQTGCKTPDAAEYIERAAARKRGKPTR